MKPLLLYADRAFDESGEAAPWGKEILWDDLGFDTLIDAMASGTSTPTGPEGNGWSR